MENRLIQQRAFFFGMVAILAILALVLVWPFTQTILLAVALVIILKPVYSWLLRKKWIKGSENRAAGVTLIIFLLVIAIPFVLIVASAITQASNLFSGLNLEGIDSNLSEVIDWLEGALSGISIGDFQIDRGKLFNDFAQLIGMIATWLGDVLVSLGQSIPSFLTNGVILLVLLFVSLPKYKAPGKQDILDIVPFPPEITQLFMDKIDSMVTAMFKGTFVIAIAQGAAMGLVLWIAGVPYVMFFTLLSMVLSLIPLIGISLVAWPIGIVLLLSGNTWQGLFVIGAFILIVANIDTALRPVLVPKDAYLNPALLILGVFGGLSLMGLIGALYGPVILILLVTSIEVYSKYLLRSDLEALQEAGRIDLEELGLTPQADQGEAGGGTMFTNVLKSIAARFRSKSSVGEDPSQSEQE
jgi:predicted PurR-regulated permease PerM